jgi:hypothetical protein
MLASRSQGTLPALQEHILGRLQFERPFFMAESHLSPAGPARHLCKRSQSTTSHRLHRAKQVASVEEGYPMVVDPFRWPLKARQFQEVIAQALLA